MFEPHLKIASAMARLGLVLILLSCIVNTASAGTVMPAITESPSYTMTQHESLIQDVMDILRGFEYECERMGRNDVEYRSSNLDTPESLSALRSEMAALGDVFEECGKTDDVEPLVQAHCSQELNHSQEQGDSDKSLAEIDTLLEDTSVTGADVPVQKTYRSSGSRTVNRQPSSPRSRLSTSESPVPSEDQDDSRLGRNTWLARWAAGGVLLFFAAMGYSLHCSAATDVI